MLHPDALIRLRNLVFIVLYNFARVMVKARHDRLLKLEFVSQDRLRNDMNTSKEKLVLLMPKFVLERINYLEMSKNFVADDAGHVAILFCDICDFDAVIKELQDNVIQLLDDVFRTFDSLCKEYGIQKIEVGSASSDRRQDLHGLRRPQVH